MSEHKGQFSQVARPAAMRGGYSLIEVLAAIGILGIGLIMAAALFPVAIKENEASNRNALGTIICENGLAIIKARLSHGAVIQTLGPADDLYEPDPNFFDPNYPAVDPNPANPVYDPNGRSTVGFAYAITPVPGTPQPNDYQIAVVSYRVADRKHTAKLDRIPGRIRDLGTDASQFIPATTVDPNMIRTGSPLIVDSVGGGFARIRLWDETSTDPNNAAMLDRKLDMVNVPGWNGSTGEWTGNVWVMYEYAPGATPPAIVTTATNSPALSTMITRTALK